MEARTASGEPKGVRCPACGASITMTRSSSHRRKVQCPKCRDVVTLGTPEPPVAEDAGDSTEAQIAELKSKVARFETLDDRITVLEKVLSQAPPKPVETPAPPTRKLKWVPCDPIRSRTLSFELEDALLHNLQTFAPRAITIQANSSDAAARQRAEWLKTIFEQAKWTVRGPQEAPVQHEGRALVFAVGAVPLPDSTAETLLAMIAAGFDVTSDLDLNLNGDEAMLITG